MTVKEMQDRQLAGEPFLVVEYRSSAVEKINYRDKVTRMAMSMVSVTHACEFGSRPITIREKVADDFDPRNFVAPFTRGQMCVWKVESMLREKGLYRGEGTLEILETQPGSHGLGNQSPRPNSAQGSQAPGK